MIDELMGSVKAFHMAKGVDFECRLEPWSPSYYGVMCSALQQIQLASKLALNEFNMHGKNPRDLGVHLIAEEAAELLQALVDGDEVATLDAMADLIYVITGRAVTFDLPLSSALHEVHASNMTKQHAAGDDSGLRRDKGIGYRPPDLKKLLADYRAGVVLA